MNVKCNFFVAICVWQIIWSANGLKLSLSNVSSKSAPIKPPSSLSNPSLKNTVSSSASETSQASFLSSISPKTSISNQEIIGNGLNFQIGVNNFPQPSPTTSPLNSVTSQNIISSSFKETDTTNLGSSVFDPLSYQSLLSSSTSNLERTNNNVLSAIQNSLSVQNNNFAAPQSITPTQLFNNGLRESTQNTGSLQTNYNNNLISTAQNVGSLQSNIANNNIISPSQNVLESNLLSNFLSNSQNLEVTSNNLLLSNQNSINSQNDQFIFPQSLTSSSLINDFSLHNIGSLPLNSLNNNLILSSKNPGLLSSVSKTVTSPLQNELLESKDSNNLVTNSLNVGRVPNNQLIQTLGTIPPNSINSNLQSGTQNTLFNTISNNIQAEANDKLLQSNNQNKNAIKTSSNFGSQMSETLSNNFISSQNIGQINNGQNIDINPYFRNLGPLQSKNMKNVQNSQNIVSSQIDMNSNQILNPSLTFSPNSIDNNVPIIPSFSQSNPDFNSIQSTITSNNNLINSPPAAASIANSNNDLLNYLIANNLLPSQIPTTNVTKSFIQNSLNANPLLSETMSNKIALSEVLSESLLPVTNPYNKFNLPTPAEVAIQNNFIANSDVVSNYNKNVLLQQLNNNIYENAALNNNKLQTQNLGMNSGSQGYLQNNVQQSINLEKALLQNILASKLLPNDNVLNLPLTNDISQNNIFGSNNQNFMNYLSNNLKFNNSSNIESYLYNNLINKLQSQLKPINNKARSKIDINNQFNINPADNNIKAETFKSNDVHATDYLNTILNSQSSSGLTSAEIINKVNNKPGTIIPPLPSALLNSLINNKINNPNTAYLEYLTQTTTPPTQLFNRVPVTEYSAPTVPNYPNILNFPQGNNFAPSYSNLYNNKIPQQLTGPMSGGKPELYPEIVALNNLNNLQNSPRPIGSESALNTVTSLQSTDICGSSEINKASSISSLYPFLSNLQPTVSKLGSIKPDILSSQDSLSYHFPTNIAQPSLLQSLYPITGLPSVNTNLGPIDNNFLFNRNIQNNALPNLVSISPTPNLNVNGITEGIQIKPNPYLTSDIPTPDLINRLKLLAPETLSISPEYLAYLNLISKVPSQSSFPVQQTPDLSAINLTNQMPSLNNLAEITGANLNTNPYLPPNPVQIYNNLYSSLGIDSLITTNSLLNTESTETLSDDKISVSASIGSTDSSIETVTGTTLTNPYAIPSIADLPNVLASNYLSLPQLYNNLYNQISPSNLIVPKIENLISTAGLTKSITDLGNDIAQRYIDNLRTKKTNPVYPPLVYNSVLPTPNTIPSSSETIIPNTNISPTIPTQPLYPTNLAVPPPISPSLTESFKEVEQAYPFSFPSLPQTTLQTEISQVSILPTFYPTEISVYSPSVLPTPNINYPVYPPYMPTPPMTFPPIPPLFPPMPPIIETPILKVGSSGQDTRRLIELLLITGLFNNNDCNDRGTLEALIALMLAT